MRRMIRSSRVDAVAPPEGISPSVLVVDTNEECARSLAELLEFCGYSVSVAIDGQMALALAEPQPDILITELSLPDLDGYELVRRMRELAGTKPLLVIAVTVWQPDDAPTASGKIDLWYLKPADPKVLLPALARFTRSLAPNCGTGQGR
jgi:two-component system OmpR family response regulator